jgi:hypothetical protein
MQSKKLGSSFKQLLDQAEEGAVVNALIRMEAEPTADQRAALEALGCDIRTVAGDVITVRIPVKSLDELTERSEVLYAELAQPLYPEATD